MSWYRLVPPGRLTSEDLQVNANSNITRGCITGIQTNKAAPLVAKGDIDTTGDLTRVDDALPLLPIIKRRVWRSTHTMNK